MKPHIIIILRLAVLFMMTGLFFCGELPENPILNPANVQLHLFTKNSGDMLRVGASYEVGLAITLSQHIKTIRLYAPCGQIDTLFSPRTTDIYDTIYINPVFNTSGPCMIIATAVLLDSSIANKYDTTIIHIYPAPPEIRFSERSYNMITHSNTIDTLICVTSVAGGVNLPPSYTVSSKPALNESQLYMMYSSIKDTIYLIVNRAPADTYTLSLSASADVPDDDPVGDTVVIGIRIFKPLEVVTVDAPQTICTGTSDTLVFTVDNHDRDDRLSLSLLDEDAINSTTVSSILVSGPDSIVITVSPSIIEELYIDMIITNGTLADTIKYPVTVVAQDAQLWNMNNISIEATEGTVLHHDLKQYFIPPVEGEVQFSADVGSISADTLWQWTPDWGGDATATAVITAHHEGTSHRLALNLNVTPGDNNPPVIRLADPGLSGKKVSASQITVNCIVKDRGAGIDKVTLFYGTKAVDATLQNDSIFSGSLAMLIPDVKSEITITATDRSMKRNTSSMQFYVIYDSTLEDEEPPIIKYISGPRSGDRVTAPESTIICSIMDHSGVDSVWWQLNGAARQPLAMKGDGIFTLTYTLTSFNSNYITIYAVDGSSNSNRGSITINLNYNTKPSAIIPSLPVDRTSGIDTLPTFAWQGGSDSDGDPVFFEVFYGVTNENLSFSTGELSINSIKLSSINRLQPLTRYYWQVIAWSKVFPDTVRSAVNSFTTLDPSVADKTPPLISQCSGPENKARVISSSATFTFSITDLSGIDTVYTGLNNDKLTVLIPKNDSSYHFTCEFSYGENTVLFEAVDKSANRNRSRYTVSVNYNTLIESVTCKAPADKAIGVDTLTAFQWTGGDDPDGDPVYFTIHYGLTVQDLDHSTPETTDRTYRLLPSDKLATNTTYYWQVYAYSKITEDKVASEIRSFTTLIHAYTLSYNKNGGVGKVPTDTEPYTSGAICIVKDTVEFLTRNGFEFAGWNTAPDGTGMTYKPGDSFTFGNNDITLYALWNAKPDERYAYYPFNGNANDASGKGHDLTVFGAILTEDRNGHANSAYLFNGIDNYLQLESMTDFGGGTQPRTIAGWFKSDSNNDEEYMMLFGFGTPKDTFNFQVGSGPCSGEYNFRVNGWGSPRDWCTGVTSAELYDGKWHHCAVTYDGTTTKLYLDGILNAETTTYHYLCDPTTMTLVIGREIDLAGWEFEGALDDIVIYTTVLSAEEVYVLFQSQE